MGEKKGWLDEEQLETEASRFLLAWLVTWSQGLKEKCPLREGKEEIQEGSEKCCVMYMDGPMFPVFRFFISQSYGAWHT